jgi:hypothetical protein
MTPAEEAAMHREHAAYCLDKATKRAAEGRHDIARRWRLDAQDAEGKAREVEQRMEPAAAGVSD